MEIYLPFGYILRMPTPNGQESSRHSSPVFPTSPTPPIQDSFTTSPPPVFDEPPLTTDKFDALFDEMENGPKTPPHSPDAALGELLVGTGISSSEAPFDTVDPRSLQNNPFQFASLTHESAYVPLASEAEAVDWAKWVKMPIENASDIESAPESDKAESPTTAKAPEKRRSNRQGMVNERIAVINDYKSGEKNRAKLAKKHGVKPHTVGSWVRRFEERPDTPFFKTDAELQTTDKADRKALKDQPAPDAPGTEFSHKRKRSSEEGGGLEIAVPSPKRPTALKHVLGMDWEDWIVSDHV